MRPIHRASITAFRNFSIDLLPEEVTYDLLQDFKVVIANGDFLDPDASVTVTSYIQRAGTFFPDTLVSSTHSREGNGFTVVNDTHTTSPFVLAPANDYALVLQLLLDLSSQPTPGVPGELILEFGGISAFSGFDFVATGTPIPEPTTVHLFAFGLVGLVVRRRWLT